SVTPVLSAVSLAYVTLGGLDHLGLAPVSATVSAGTSQAYTATGYDSQDNSLGDVTGATTFSIRAGGTCTGARCTASVPGDYTVTGTDGSASGTASLHVTLGGLDHLGLAPVSATVSPGTSQAYTATGYDSQDNSLGDVTGASCTASVPGDYTVTGTDGSASGTATLHVVAGAILITLQPANTVTTAGQTASFSAAATGTPTPTVRWQVSSNGGTSF